MLTREQIEVRSRMQAVLADFIPTLSSWMTENDRLLDPFETEYSENYAPANAAVLLASVYRARQDPQVLDLLTRMLNRSVELLRDKAGVVPFCRVFLFHYSLMAMLLLPEPERERIKIRYAGFYAEYKDDCPQINTNCAALQLGMELFVEALGFRPADTRLLKRLISFIAEAQLESGFINDEIDHKEQRDGMPIAYHAFTLFILCSTLAVMEHTDPSHSDLVLETKRILSEGINWLKHTISLDGTFAMVERSSYQMFTWGAFITLYCSSGMNIEGFLVRTFEQWLSYRKEDGSYSCVPNHLPHSLRCGFESYTHVNMYNLLGLTGIAISDLLLEREMYFHTGDRLPEQNSFVDPGSGYAFLRKGGDFFGCTLRMHNRTYAPAMQGFHFRVGGEKIPLGEPRLPGYKLSADMMMRDGIWEGYWLEAEDGTLHYPDVSANVEITPVENGFRMVLENGTVRCVKTIRLIGEGVEWEYDLTPKTALQACFHVLPLLMHDGNNSLMAFERRHDRIDLAFGSRRYLLECDASESISISLSRSLLSVSGAASKAHIRIAGPLNTEHGIKWRTRLSRTTVQQHTRDQNIP